MSSLVFNGQHVAPELSKKLFEHYPKLEMQLDVLVRVTHEMECLVDQTNAIFSDAEPKISGAIERAREVAVNTSIPVNVLPQPKIPPAAVPLTENVVAANEPTEKVGGVIPSNPSVIPAPLPEQGRAVLTTTGHLMHKLWRRM